MTRLRTGRGGSRNRRGRSSEALSEPAVRRIIAAAEFAPVIGLPLNRFTTIHWQKADVSDGLAATGRFLKLARDWLRLQGGGFAFVWVREGGPAKGEHVHILLHVPPDLAAGFRRRVRGWLKACGASWRRGVIYSRPVGRSLRHAMGGEVYAEPYSDHLAVAVAYVVKGTSRDAAEALNLARLAEGGEVRGKRSGVSQNLGRAARDEFAAVG
jgi:hypothetical protein